MVRRILLAFGATALAVLALPAGPAAAGGGGCHGEAATGTGDTVEMVDACFTPTTLEVDVGATVMFVNRDPITHNVSAMGWGELDPMSAGDSYTTTFDEAGVFPFACTYHPGMTGAIVVGGGIVDGARTALGGASEASPPAAGAQPAPAWLLPGGIGLALGLGAGWLARRRSDRAVDQEPGPGRS